MNNKQKIRKQHWVGLDCLEALGYDRIITDKI